MHITRNIKQLCLPLSATIATAASLIQEQDLKVVLVCDEFGILKGTITDGDIRRSVLMAQSSDTCLSEIMNANPQVVCDGQHDIDDVCFKMKHCLIKYIPVLFEDGSPKGLYFLRDFESDIKLENPVVLMSGGLGMRLRPLTESIPKPLLKVGGKPVIQRLIEQLARQGFYKIYISINYLGESIKEYLGDGSEYDVEITYLHETKPLGTAGSLSLLDAQAINLPFLVINADIITHEELSRALLHFDETDAELSIGVKEHYYTLPYGSVNMKGNYVTGLDEKPTYTYPINSGVYVLSPDTLKFIPSNIPFDMVDLINKLLDMRKAVSYFKMYEEWIDIGQFHDLNRARETIAG